MKKTITHTQDLRYQQQTQACHELQVGALVWAKIQHYPWWPAKITKTIRQPKSKTPIYKVSFFADPTYCFLERSKIILFEQFEMALNQQFQKEAIFQKAIQLANNAYLKKQEQMKNIEQNLTVFENNSIHNRVHIEQQQQKQQHTIQKLQALKSAKANQSFQQQSPLNSSFIQCQSSEALALQRKGSPYIDNNSKAVKEKIIKQMLIKYRLDNIPTLQYAKNNLKLKNRAAENIMHNDSELVNHKKKPIVKQNKLISSCSSRSWVKGNNIKRKTSTAVLHYQTLAARKLCMILMALNKAEQCIDQQTYDYFRQKAAQVTKKISALSSVNGTDQRKKFAQMFISVIQTIQSQNGTTTSCSASIKVRIAQIQNYLSKRHSYQIERFEQEKSKFTLVQQGQNFTVTQQQGQMALQ